MQEELSQIGELSRIKVIRNGEEKLGAEVGSIFVEFDQKKHGEITCQKLKGRVYDGRKIEVCYIDEPLYFSDLFIK